MGSLKEFKTNVSINNSHSIKEKLLYATIELGFVFDLNEHQLSEKSIILSNLSKVKSNDNKGHYDATIRSLTDLEARKYLDRIENL